MNQINKAMKKEYYYLEEGEIIKEGDEVEISSKYNDPPKWEKTNCVGQIAPNPNFMSHRVYRRSINIEMKIENILQTDFGSLDDLTVEKLLNLFRLNHIEEYDNTKQLPTLEVIECRFPSEVGQEVIMEEDMSYDDTRQANYYRRQGAKWFHDLINKE